MKHLKYPSLTKDNDILTLFKNKYLITNSITIDYDNNKEIMVVCSYADRRNNYAV